MTTTPVMEPARARGEAVVQTGPCHLAAVHKSHEILALPDVNSQWWRKAIEAGFTLSKSQATVSDTSRVHTNTSSERKGAQQWFKAWQEEHTVY